MNDAGENERTDRIAGKPKPARQHGRPWRQLHASPATDRGLHVVDGSSIDLLALSSLLLWERNVGRVALEP